MALNLKTLGIRSLSAAVFVILLVGSVLWNYYSFFIFFFAVAILGLKEFYKIAVKLGAHPFKFFGFAAAILILVSCFQYKLVFPDSTSAFLTGSESVFFPVLIISSFLILSIPVFKKENATITDSIYTIGGIIYTVMPFVLLNFVVNRNDFNPYPLLAIIVLIWSNDTFAYLGGSLFGKHKMIERISPGKTWEGTAIGVIVTFGISFIIPGFISGIDGLWPVLGILVPIVATIGDLIESKLKREAGIKDSGAIMPGHGGILDRFDSLIFVSPFIYAVFKIYSCIA